jgi:hypothetical protein
LCPFWDETIPFPNDYKQDIHRTAALNPSTVITRIEQKRLSGGDNLAQIRLSTDSSRTIITMRNLIMARRRGAQ